VFDEATTDLVIFYSIYMLLLYFASRKLGKALALCCFALSYLFLYFMFGFEAFGTLHKLIIFMFSLIGIWICVGGNE